MLKISFDYGIGCTKREGYRGQRWVAGGILRKGRGAQHEQVRTLPMLQVHTYHRFGFVSTYNRTPLKMSRLVPCAVVPLETGKWCDFNGSHGPGDLDGPGSHVAGHPAFVVPPVQRQP